MWLFYALLAASLWGVGQVFTKKGFAHLSPLWNNIFAVCVWVVALIPFTMFKGVNYGLFPKIFPLVLLITAIYTSYYYIVSKGDISLTGTILSTYPLVTVICSGIFLKEQTSIVQKLAVGLTILGSVIIALPTKKGDIKKFKLEDWVIWASLGAIMMGFADFLAKIAINMSDGWTYTFTSGVSFIPVTIVLYLLDKKGRALPKFNLKKFLPTFIGVTMVEIGLVPFNLAFASGLASLAGPVSTTYVIITVILAFIFLKEKVTKIQLAGITSTVIGIILLGFS